MKKVLLSTLAMALSFFVYAQPVSDNATIPVSVTVNSILRLHVTSGGNIEFVFNTLNDMTNGISNSEGTTTRFTIASSQVFDVDILAESATMTGTDVIGGGTFNINEIGYTVDVSNGTGTNPAGALDILTAAPVEIIQDGQPGDVTDNIYSIAWECSTAAVAGAGGGAQGVLGVAPDRYSTNVFLIVAPN